MDSLAGSRRSKKGCGDEQVFGPVGCGLASSFDNRLACRRAKKHVVEKWVAHRRPELPAEGVIGSPVAATARHDSER